MNFLLCAHDTLELLTPQQLQLVPKEVLIKYYPRQINKVYGQLSETLKNDPDIKNHLICYEHYNKLQDHIDGPPPMKKDCHICSCYNKCKLHAVI